MNAKPLEPPNAMHTDRLCQTGRGLYAWYRLLLPMSTGWAEARDEWYAHKLGCAVCSGLKADHKADLEEK